MKRIDHRIYFHDAVQTVDLEFKIFIYRPKIYQDKEQVFRQWNV